MLVEDYFLVDFRGGKSQKTSHYQPFVGDELGLLLLLLLFLTFSVLVANPKKLLYTVANPARSWSAEQGKENKRKSLCLQGSEKIDRRDVVR